jgi:hypothetical protein
MEYILLKNVHESLPAPTNSGISYIAKQPYEYYHYKCDDLNDTGWGCGYRTTQSICSSLQQILKKGKVPTIPEIQEILIKIGDKNESFLNSRSWIGTLEVQLSTKIFNVLTNFSYHFQCSYVIDEIFGTPCYLHHVKSFEGLKSKKDELVRHFSNEQSCLIMMGGDIDASSKGIVGTHVSHDSQIFLLVVDPHFVGHPKSAQELIDKGYVKWYAEDEFLDQSFYNFCMPKIN